MRFLSGVWPSPTEEAEADMTWEGTFKQILGTELTKVLSSGGQTREPESMVKQDQVMVMNTVAKTGTRSKANAWNSSGPGSPVWTVLPRELVKSPDRA